MYDPLADSVMPHGVHKPESFWAQNYPEPQYPALQGDIETDVVIIGGGYTGLSAAYHLRNDYGLKTCLLEANQPGWGCSGRNGGFVLPGSGRLGVQDYTAAWGVETGHAVFEEFQYSVSMVNGLIDSGIPCDRVQGGYLKLAHTPAHVAPLYQQAELMADQFSEGVVALSSKDITNTYLSGTENHGGVFYPDAFAVNPWRLAQGLAQCADKAGAELFGGSPVLETTFNNKVHTVTTLSGTVKAKTLILATNAYGLRKQFPILQDRTFPVLSSVIVTEPLSESQLASVGMRAGLMVMDTRPLKYYYRLLPDNRLLFGGRGAVTGQRANDDKYKIALQKGLLSTFPQLKGIKVKHFWSGWVSVSFDNYPRLHHDEQTQTLYSAGYCGAGLAFSILAGKRLSQLLNDPSSLPSMPFWQSPLSRFPAAGLRRPALRLFYQWEALKRQLGY